MIELIQFPWSPFCIVQRRILEFSGRRFKIINIPNGDRSWSGNSPGSVITACPSFGTANRLFSKSAKIPRSSPSIWIPNSTSACFPWELEGVQSILWRYIENEIEGSASS